MMPPSKESRKIAGIFNQYAKTGDKSLIEGLKLKDIEIALIQYSAYKHFPHYSAMERRIAELKETDKARKNAKERWKDKIIGFLFGIAVIVIASLLLQLLIKK